jgi:hypothetical protein
VFSSEAISADGFDQSAEIAIAQMGLIVLEYDPASSAVPDGPSEIGRSILLRRIFPNPSTGGTSIEYVLDRARRVRLSVHDVTGRLVKELVETDQPAGASVVVWDGRGAGGKLMPAGIYSIRLQVGEDVTTRKFSLVR